MALINLNCRYSLFVIILILKVSSLYAQEDTVSVKNKIQQLSSVRNTQSSTDAKDIINKVIEHKDLNPYTRKEYAQYDFYQKTTAGIIGNRDTIHNEIIHSKSKHNFVSKYVIKPITPWLEYARPAENPNEAVLSILLFEDYKTIFSDYRNRKTAFIQHASKGDGFFQLIGQQNFLTLLDEMFGDIDLYQDENDMMLLTFKSPLGANAPNIYTYRLIREVQVNGEMCNKIAFYSDNMKENTFSGYLYTSTDGKYALVKTEFTFNNSQNLNFLKDVLITQHYALEDSIRVPSSKETLVLIGDEAQGGVIAKQVSSYYDFSLADNNGNSLPKSKLEKNYQHKDSTYWAKIRPFPLALSEAQTGNLQKAAVKTPYFKRIQDLILIMMSNHVTLGGINGAIEIGPLSQAISYNQMEGIRLKIGGNNTVALSNHFLLGGYSAYGFKDETVKYRGDIIYSLEPRTRYIWEYPKRLFSFTWVNDLNIPGQDLLTTTRDNFIYSFSHNPTNNMSLQRIGILAFENEVKHNFSYKIGGKFTYDRPEGVVQYLQVNGTDTTMVGNITISEVSVSLRYAPRERFIQNRDKRIYVKKGEFELNLNYRAGIKGIFGSDYNYQAVEIKAYKKINYTNNAGGLDIHLSAGKIWDRVPFPLLFIPAGSQSYIYQPENYNCMNFYEFTTDRYIAANLSSTFNWSPFEWFKKNRKIKTTLGGKIIYGPLSDNNNPLLHPELFIFNQGVQPLGDTPYAEVSVGFANVFKFLRIEYVRRLTYFNTDAQKEGRHKILKGSLFFTGSFAF